MAKFNGSDNGYQTSNYKIFLQTFRVSKVSALNIMTCKVQRNASRNTLRDTKTCSVTGVAQTYGESSVSVWTIFNL